MKSRTATHTTDTVIFIRSKKIDESTWKEFGWWTSIITGCCQTTKRTLHRQDAIRDCVKSPSAVIQVFAVVKNLPRKMLCIGPTACFDNVQQLGPLSKGRRRFSIFQVFNRIAHSEFTCEFLRNASSLNRSLEAETRANARSQTS